MTYPFLGADINSYNSLGFTGLHTAVCLEYDDALLLLLELGADPNVASNKGITYGKFTKKKLFYEFFVKFKGFFFLCVWLLNSFS
jgi:ankyrin repeat protein